MSFEYSFLSTLEGDLRDRKLLKTVFTYNLDDTGNLALKSEYVNGDTTSALEDQDLYTLGLGVKF